MPRETSTTYRWGEGQAIRRIDVRTDKRGHAVAYLYADNSDAAQQQRNDIRAAIRLKGWGTLSDNRDGAFALRVSGMRDADQLIGMLGDQGFLHGTPQVERNRVEGGRAQTPLTFVRDNSLRLSAAIYTLGNLFYFKGANKPEDKKMALSFGFGDVMLGLFGGRDDNRQFTSLLHQMKTHMERTGIEIPGNASIHVETSDKDRGFFDKAGDLLHTHINSIKIMSEIVGGWFVLSSGLKRDTEGPLAGKRNRFMIAGGLLVMAGWAGALLVKEKKQDKERPATGLVDGAARHFEEKPLRLAGYAGLGFNALKISEAFVNKRATSGWNKAAVASMLSANTLYSMSNKTAGGDIRTEAMVKDVYAVACQILNKQPDAQREQAMASVARFLGERPEIRDTHAEILERLKHEMALQRQNPWFEKLGLTPYTPAPKGRTRDAVEQLPSATIQRAGLELNSPAPHAAAATAR